MKSLAFAALLVAGSAHAYVRTTSASGTPVRWQQSCVVMQADLRGDQSADNITIDDINTSLSNAVSDWNGGVGDCTYMRLGVIPAYQVLEPVSDGRPSVVFRSDNWSHDASVIALTTVWLNNKPGDATDGLIADADIELNAQGYTFTTDTTGTTSPRTGTSLANLQNTLTHELGHVLGLGHTCWDHVLATAPLDNNGIAAPDCFAGNLPASVTSATMYPFTTSPGSISMETLSSDDIAGICESYPSTGTPSACYGNIEARGCSVAPRAPESRAAWLLSLGALVAVWIGRRMGRSV